MKIFEVWQGDVMWAVDVFSHWVASPWFSNLLAMAALGLSVTAYRRSGPKVRITLSSGLNLAPNEPVSVVMVTVANNGASAIHFQSVRLVASVGAVRAFSGPTFPHSLEANGGTASWQFDRNALRTEAGRDGSPNQTQYRAWATSGRRRFKSRSVETVHPHEPTVQPRRSTGRVPRFKIWLRSWATPHMQAVGGIVIQNIDLDDGTYVQPVRNFGGGTGRGATLELMRSDELGHLVPVGDPIAVPSLHRHSESNTRVPFAAVEGLWWYLRYKGRARVGVAAMTREEAASHVEEMKSVHRQKPDGNEEGAVIPSSGG